MTLYKKDIKNLDINNPIERYIINIYNHKIPIGINNLLSIKRYLNMKSRADIYLDIEEVERIITISNLLTVVKNGRIEKLKTRDFQNFILGNIVGWKYKANGLQLFREAYIQIGRQNGKSLLQATLLLYYSGFKNFRNSRLFCAATKKEQAKIVWQEVANFINSNKFLRNKYYKIQDHNGVITNTRLNNKIIALSKDTKSLDGFDSVLGVVDEYHAHNTNQMYKLLLDGQVNVPNSLIVAITTAGFDLQVPCYEHYEYCVNILNNLIEKDSIFIFICDLDKNDDVKDYRNWIKANPFLLLNYDYSVNKQNIEKFKDAMNDAFYKQGQEMTNFLTKKLNFWVQSTENDFLNKEAIKESACELTLEYMRGRKAYLGLDLSSGGDLTSLAVVIPYDDKVFIHSHSFIPEECILAQEKIAKVPYRDWVKRELLTPTMGFKTDYSYILRYLKDLITTYNLEIIALGYDPYNAGAFLSDLDETVQADLVSITQSARNLGSCVEDFKITLEGKEILFNKDNDLLKWSLSVAKVEYNSFNEPKVKKYKGREKIDPVMAIIDAWYLYFNKRDELLDINDSFDKWLDLYNS